MLIHFSSFFQQDIMYYQFKDVDTLLLLLSQFKYECNSYSYA